MVRLDALRGGGDSIVTWIFQVRSERREWAFERERLPQAPPACLPEVSISAKEAAERWHTGDLLVIHRYGPLAPGDMIMMVATAAPHRADAFQAAEFLMDFLKSRAPFWKKEVAQDGADWVAARDEDEDALGRW